MECVHSRWLHHVCARVLRFLHDHRQRLDDPLPCRRLIKIEQRLNVFQREMIRVNRNLGVVDLSSRHTGRKIFAEGVHELLQAVGLRNHVRYSLPDSLRDQIDVFLAQFARACDLH